MTNISSITNTTQTKSSYQAKGFSGLVSGMDTESVVESMTADIQSKIDKVKQEQTRNEWKQDAYREVITQLTDFQDKYFSYTNPKTNILSAALYNVGTKSAQGANASKINVTSTSTSADAAYKITSVSQLATRTTYNGVSGLGGNTISTGDISFGDRKSNVAAGKEIEITYDNKKYTLTIPEDISIAEDGQGQALADALNKAMDEQTISGGSTKLSERLKFTADSGTLKLSALSTTDTRSFEITGGDDVALQAAGLTKGQKGKALEPIYGENPVDAVKASEFSLTGKKMVFNLNDREKTISFSEADSSAIMAMGTDEERLAKMAEIFNQKLEDAFGAGKINVSVNGSKLDFTVGDSTSTLSISSSSTDTMGKNGIFGINSGTSNRLDTSKTLKELGIQATVVDENDPNNSIYKITVNGKDFEFKGNNSVSTVISKLNNDKEAGVNISYLNTTNKFSIAADEYGSTEKLSIADSGEGGNLAQMLFGKIADSSLSDEEKGIVAGQDLKMTIRYDGEDADTVIERNSNSVNLDGVKFNVEGTFDETSEAVTFKSDVNTDDVVKVIKDMADDYNKILDKINEHVTTKKATKNGSTYEPLTDAQKKEMSKDEIEAWEKKAKEGLLFGDSTLSQLASKLRFAFSSIVAGTGYGKEIGITTASSYSGNGKISIDENKLKEALTNDPEKVRTMFTASAEDARSSTDGIMSGGFATRVKTIFESYAKTTGSNKGKLVSLAGLKNNPTTNDNYIARQQKMLKTKLTNLEKLLSKRQDRYQKQFSNLEVYISKMNSQSSWLAGAMG